MPRSKDLSHDASSNSVAPATSPANSVPPRTWVDDMLTEEESDALRRHAKEVDEHARKALVHLRPKK
jgi:hypothetical protein